METPAEPHSPAEATHDLIASADARMTFVNGLTLPRGYSLVGGIGHAALVYGVALGNSTWRFGSVAFILGLAVQMIAVTAALRMFQAQNGASVRGIAGFGGPHSTRLVVAAFLVVLIAGIVGATWLMVAERPFLSALVALALIPATAIADRWWISRLANPE